MSSAAMATPLVLAMALAMTLAMAMVVETFLPAGAGKGEKLAEEGLALLSLSPSLPTLAAANQL